MCASGSRVGRDTVLDQVIRYSATRLRRTSVAGADRASNEAWAPLPGQRSSRRYNVRCTSQRLAALLGALAAWRRRATLVDHR